jgi:hypothetical protein
MSSEKTPVLASGISHFEEFMSELEVLAKDYPILKPWTGVALRWAKKYYCRMDGTDAYVITMCKSFY